MKALTVRPETLKTYRKTGSKHSDIALNNNFLDRPPQARATKEKVNKWDHSKLKSFCGAKETINKTTH